MRQKLIVKDLWLSFLPISLKQQTTLQALILEGKTSSANSIPAAIEKHLGSEDISYILEKTNQVLGRPAAILNSLEALPNQIPAEKKHQSLWQERVFLKGFALSRLGHTNQSEFWFQLLPDSYSPKINTERALIKLNRGEIIEADALFRKALNESSGNLDPYSMCTLLGGWSLALIQTGLFRDAEQAIKKRRLILKTHTSESLEFGTRLYEILLLLERNSFADASELLSRALADQGDDSINVFFLRHLKLRLHLARNELPKAKSIIDSFKSENLTKGILDFRIEEIDWNLRSGNPIDALKLIAQLEKTHMQVDYYFNFRLSILKAQAFYQNGDFNLAYAEISDSMKHAEKRRYLPTLTWALFHGAGIALAAGQSLQAKHYLHRGERLSSDLGLRARFACFSYISEILHQAQSSGHALLSLVRRKEIGTELEYYLGTYQLLTEVSLKVLSRQGNETLNESDLRRQLFSEDGLFWFQNEKILLANQGDGHMKIVDFSMRPQLLSTFKFFWNAFQYREKGLNLAEVHQTKHAATYREELHAGAAKTQISRLRELLKTSGLKIAYDRDQRLYSLESTLNPLTLLSHEEVAVHSEKSKSRTEEILARISMEPFVPTRILCHEFKVSRQALHPHLSKLTANKQIRLVKRGPISGYIFIAKK